MTFSGVSHPGLTDFKENYPVHNKCPDNADKNKKSYGFKVF